MLENKITNETYYKNGNLSYTETLGIIAKGYEHLYPNRIHNMDTDVSVIRLGSKKFWDNNQLHWELKYDEFGNVIKDRDQKEYQKNGSVIVY
jgi:hypothetical protein